MEVLLKGSRNDEVRKLQRLLGFADKDIDGIFGSNTEKAVRAFQERNGLVVDGVVGEKTWSALVPPQTLPGGEGFDKNDVLIILGTAHLRTTPGKCSPDGDFKEYSYSRERVAGVKAILEGLGYRVVVDYPSSEPLPAWTEARKKLGYQKGEQRMELQYRVNVVNSYCKLNKKVVYVSMHTDAAPGTDWSKARGFSVRVSPKAGEDSRRLGQIFTKRAGDYEMLGNRATPKSGYWEQQLKVLNDVSCPAVLTETGFQNNREDVEWLLSDEGKHMVERLHVESIVEYIEGL